MKPFTTHDIVLASVLQLEQFNLLGIEFDPINKSRAHFLFESTPDLLQVVQDYFLGKILVEPNRFHNETRALTTLIRNTKTQSV